MGHLFCAVLFCCSVLLRPNLCCALPCLIVLCCPVLQMFAQLLGSLLGSQLMPMLVGAGDGRQVVDPAHPRRTMYGMFAGSLLFIPAFALALHFGGPAPLIVLVFLLYTYGG
jgi:hypothetical protein